LGVTLVIDSDAHKFEALDNQRFGVATARRGWCQAKHILNTLPLAEFLSFLGLEKSPRTKALSGNG
jgi:DNA polymerase (family 10)